MERMENKNTTTLQKVIFYAVFCAILLEEAAVAIACKVYETSALLFALTIICAVVWTVVLALTLKAYRAKDEK